jgi:hypothetical protein
MQNPAEADDSDGEWFEVYNVTGADVDLVGLQVYDLDGGGAVSTSFTVGASLVVPAGGHVVLGVNADTAGNGGVTLSYEYSSAFQLGNTSDELYLANATLVIDAIAWDDGATFPDPTGASMSLSEAARDAASNDSGANWCTATTAYGSGDLGTPGADNDC